MIERDPALLPGPTAGQWQGRARLVFAASVGLLLVTLGALGFGWRPHPVVLIVPGVVILAGFVAWIVLGESALRRMRAEHDSGYSTTLDVSEIDLRDPRTGVLVRAAGEPPVQPRQEALVWRMLQFPRGSLLDRSPRD
ncbi:hypothetical protein [Pseudolysinimonas yzui]|uniref:Uncharacterized protein n=1 Tax=Pseudolysinimonas yzui TaxID=2708254 RepID=A0A8J3GSW8_9MICO|nr:hypothetical protein [Pseudolysinimonas yzui]GHF24458.1 hypothetical protein GCM10011600_26890 [Pseudolysinimonas yzui]